MVEHAVLTFENVSFSYNGNAVLEGANLHVYNRDFACIVGPNGGGKTTLLMLALGLLSPQSGTIKLFGESPEKARKRIGYVPQSPDLDLDFPVTVNDVVRMGRLGNGGLFGRFTKDDKLAVQKALEDVRIADLSGRPLSQLSGGQRQRVLIARALAGNPDMLVLDEPTAGLDPRAGSDFMALLEELNERHTIIMVSHELGFVPEQVKTVHCVNKKIVLHPTGEVPEGMRDSVAPGTRIVLHDRHDPSCECGDDQ
jgi:zinc transport system ATP-binding protein